MDRNALLIYLRDLRDLEVARYRINELIKQKSWQASKTKEAVACMKHYTTMKAHLEAWEKNQKERVYLCRQDSITLSVGKDRAILFSEPPPTVR